MKETIIYTQGCDGNSILVVSSSGKIKQLFIPFKVVCIKPVGEIELKTLLFVEEVLSNDRDQLIYFIWGKHFYHASFLIL